MGEGAWTEIDGILAFLAWVCGRATLKTCERCPHLRGHHASGTCEWCSCEMCPHGWYRGNDCEWCNPLPY